MTALEKFNLLVGAEAEDSKVKITTTEGVIYHCKIHCPAEDDEDWAYNLISPDCPTKYFMLKCDEMAKIEEISKEEWQAHLEDA